MNEPLSRIKVKNTALSLDEAYRAVARPEAGAVVLFIGTVRNENAERPVTRLDYEAYLTMAEAEMGRIASEIEAELSGTRLCAFHRIGELQVGELAVVVAASAPHRGEAFSACRLMIDRVKERVPIWKREHGPDGPHWIGWEDARAPASG